MQPLKDESGVIIGFVGEASKDAKNQKNSNLYEIVKLSFFGSDVVFSSDEPREVAINLVGFRAYKQPLMMDAGFWLMQGDSHLKIDPFVEKELNEEEIQKILSEPVKVSTPIGMADAQQKLLSDILQSGTDIMYVDAKYVGAQTSNPLADLSPEAAGDIIANCIKKS